MQNPNRSAGKVTLVDLLSLMSFTTPLFGAIAMGWKMGIFGALIGSSIGLSIGVLVFIGFRRGVRLLAEYPMGNWKGPKGAVFFVGTAYLALFGSGFLAMWSTDAAVGQQIAPQWLLAAFSMALWCWVLVWIRSKNLFTRKAKVRP